MSILAQNYYQSRCFEVPFLYIDMKIVSLKTEFCITSIRYIILKVDYFALPKFINRAIFSRSTWITLRNKLRECSTHDIAKFIYYLILAHTFCNFENIFWLRISRKRYEIRQTLLWSSNRKSYMAFDWYIYIWLFFTWLFYKSMWR